MCATGTRPCPSMTAYSCTIPRGAPPSHHSPWRYCWPSLSTDWRGTSASMRMLGWHLLREITTNIGYTGIYNYYCHDCCILVLHKCKILFSTAIQLYSWVAVVMRRWQWLVSVSMATCKSAHAMERSWLCNLMGTALTSWKISLSWSKTIFLRLTFKILPITASFIVCGVCHWNIRLWGSNINFWNVSVILMASLVNSWTSVYDYRYQHNIIVDL